MTADRFKPLLDRQFLKAELHYEYEAWQAAAGDAALLNRLQGWHDREIKRETKGGASDGRSVTEARRGRSDNGAWAGLPMVGRREPERSRRRTEEGAQRQSRIDQAMSERGGCRKVLFLFFYSLDVEDYGAPSDDRADINS